MSNLEDIKKNIRMSFIYKALESGWTVKKSSTKTNAFEFTKGEKLEDTNTKNHRRSISAPIVKKFST